MFFSANGIRAPAGQLAQPTPAVRPISMLGTHCLFSLFVLSRHCFIDLFVDVIG